MTKFVSTAPPLSGSLGPFWSRPTEGWVWGASEMGCLLGSQQGAEKPISHCSFSTAVDEAHSAFTCASKQKLRGLCCVSDTGGLCTEGGQLGSISAGHRLPQAVLTEEIVLSQTFAARWPRCPKKTFSTMFLFLIESGGNGGLLMALFGIDDWILLFGWLLFFLLMRSSIGRTERKSSV